MTFSVTVGGVLAQPTRAAAVVAGWRQGRRGPVAAGRQHAVQAVGVVVVVVEVRGAERRRRQQQTVVVQTVDVAG